MAKALTAKSIEQAKPSDKRQEVADALLPGLYLVIQPSGAKSWAVRYRHGGRTRKAGVVDENVGDNPLSRELARETLTDTARGGDPAAAKVEARSQVPSKVAEVVALFLLRHTKRHNRARSSEETERLFTLHVLPMWGNRPISGVPPTEVVHQLG